MLLLTTFATWKPSQPSNASDDLVAELLKRGMLDANVQVLRHIPVDFQQAPEIVGGSTFSVATASGCLLWDGVPTQVVVC